MVKFGEREVYRGRDRAGMEGDMGRADMEREGRMRSVGVGGMQGLRRMFTRCLIRGGRYGSLVFWISLLRSGVGECR